MYYAEFITKVHSRAKNSEVEMKIIDQCRDKIVTAYWVRLSQQIRDILPCSSDEIETAMDVMESEILDYLSGKTAAEIINYVSNQPGEWFYRVELIQRDCLDSIEEANEEAEA